MWSHQGGGGIWDSFLEKSDTSGPCELPWGSGGLCGRVGISETEALGLGHQDVGERRGWYPESRSVWGGWAH